MKINSLYPSIYIIAEGIDTCGKTTQFDLVAKHFQNKGYNLMQTRQPGGTPIGKKIRSILLDVENSEMHPDTELTLYCADRVQHMRQLVIPSLQKQNQNQIFLQDRGQFTTETYQGYGRKLNMYNIKWLNNFAVGEYQPDSVLFFDISIDEMLKRKQKRNIEKGLEDDRLEKEDREFFQRIRHGMYECKKQNPDLITIIDGERSINDIQKDVISHIEKLIEYKFK
jgi:dTMP kinase